MIGKVNCPIWTKALIKTFAVPAFLGKDSISAGYVPESKNELEIPAMTAKTIAIVTL